MGYCGGFQFFQNNSQAVKCGLRSEASLRVDVTKISTSHMPIRNLQIHMVETIIEPIWLTGKLDPDIPPRPSYSLIYYAFISGRRVQPYMVDWVVTKWTRPVGR